MGLFPLWSIVLSNTYCTVQYKYSTKLIGIMLGRIVYRYIYRERRSEGGGGSRFYYQDVQRVKLCSLVFEDRNYFRLVLSLSRGKNL